MRFQLRLRYSQIEQHSTITISCVRETRKGFIKYLKAKSKQSPNQMQMTQRDFGATFGEMHANIGRMLDD